MTPALRTFGAPWVFAHRLGQAALILTAALVDTMPLTLGGLDVPLPLIALPIVFVWAVARPGVEAYVAAFAGGLAHDVVSGGPLGVWAMGFLACAAAGVMQRPALEGQGLAPVWVSFAMAALATLVVSALCGAIALNAPPALGALMVQMALTVLAAPLAARFAGGFARAASPWEARG